MIKQKTINKITRTIKKFGIISKTKLITETGVHPYTIDKALKILKNEGKVMTAKYEGFVGDTKRTFSYDIKWIDDKK